MRMALLKNVYFCVSAILFFFSLQSLAQPVLTNPGVNPVIGDRYTLNYCNYTSPGNAGTSQAWNLSALTVTATGAYTLGTVAQAPIPQFSTTSNIQMNDGSVYNFFSISNTVCANTGSRAGSTITILHSDAEELLHFPFNYTDNFSDSWAATFTLSNIAFVRNGNTSVTYDGYGSLLLTTGLYTDVARVHVVQSFTDVSAFNTTTYLNDQYLWYANGHHQALAGVFSSTVNGSASSQGAFYSADTSFFTGRKEYEKNSFQFALYPNPVADELQVSLSDGSGIQQLDLIDEMGRLVYSKRMALNPGNSLTVRLDAFSAGLYLARLTNAGGRFGTRKISIVK